MKRATLKNIKLLALLNFMMDLKLYGVIAIIYFTSVTGSMALGMSIFSITMIANAIFELPTGMLSDRIGRKRTLILGSIASLLYILCFAISNNYIWLVIGAMFEGLERAFYSGNNEALLYDTLKEDKLEHEYKTYLGKTESMYNLASMIAGVVGTVLLYFTSFKFILWLSVIPKFVNLYISFKIKEPKVHTEKIQDNPYQHIARLFKKIRKNQELKKLILADTVACSIGESTFQFRAMFYKTIWPTWALGIPGVLSSLGSFTSNWFAGKIINKYGDRKVLVCGNIYSVISNVGGYLLNSFISPFILVTNSLVPTNIAKNDLINKYYSDELRASMASLKSLIITISIAITMILVGLSADYIGVLKTLIIFSLFKLITVYVYNDVFRKKVTNETKNS